MTLLDLQIAVFPVAFAVMLVASLILWRRTQQPGFGIQTLGFVFLVASQLSMFLSYELYPAVIGSDGGLVASGPRDAMYTAETLLNVVGLLVAAFGYALQAKRSQESA